MSGLFTKSVEAITAADAEALVGWPETLTVEFKEALPGREVETYAKEN